MSITHFLCAVCHFLHIS